MESRIIDPREEMFLNMALKYMKEYEATPFWMFLKRYRLKKKWYSARECMITYRLK